MAKPKLALIPAAQGDKFYSVLPSDGVGDFDFTRNSSATRIAPTGFIEEVGAFGSDLITNGNFDNDSDWTKGTGWTISGGKANASATTGQLYQATATTINTQYKIEYTISNYVSGTYNFLLRGASTAAFSGNGTFTVYITSGSGGNSNFIIDGISAFTGSIDNISVKQVIGNQSRLNYDLLNGKVVNCPHYLLEPASTNLVPNSQDFSSGWTFDDSTITNNSAISPDGVLNAGLWKGNTVSSRHNIGVIPAPVASVTASFSLFVKAKELKYIQIASANTINQYVNFDVSSGIIGTVGSSFSNAKIENYGNGWYRCSVVSLNQYNGFYISLVSGLTATWLESWVMPNNTDGLYIWGAQLEALSYATSYIPTNGTAITRAAESANGSGNAATFNDSEGVLMLEASSTETTSVIWSVSSGSNSNAVSLYYGSQGVVCDVFSSVGVRTLIATMPIEFRSNMNKFLIKYKSTDLAIWLNGFELAVSTQTISLSGLNELEGAYGSGSFPFYGKTKQIQYFDSVLTDAQLETLTSWTSLQEMITSQLYTNY